MSKGKFATMVFAIDCDGTLIKHRFPEMGDQIPHAAETLKWMIEEGAKLILYTMRHAEHLPPAIAWFDYHGIPLWGINNNPGQKHWSLSPKVYAHHYIDDAAIGCPLIYDPTGVDRPWVDWLEVRKLLETLPEPVKIKK